MSGHVGSPVLAPAGQPARRHRRRAPGGRLVAMVGPAVVASVAYVDPGNFATDLQGGSLDGYLLVWVVVLSSAMAMFVQYLSAKLGVATGLNVVEHCGRRLGRTGRLAFWLQAETVAAATDVAEVVGGALGLRLLLGVPLPAGAVASGAAALVVLRARHHGYRAFELAVGALVLVIVGAFVYETLRLAPSPAATLGGLVPRLDGDHATLLATGIVGATIMPHAVCVHSDLATDRRPGGPSERRRLVRGARVDVVAALGVAGLVNVAMLLVGARLHGVSPGAISLGGAHAALAHLAGGTAALVFATALVCAGLSSTAVGTYSGQVVTESLTPWHVPLVLRRAVSVVPAVALVGSGVDPTNALVLSQVVLAFGLPVALVPLVGLTASRSVMGDLANPRTVTLLAVAVTGLVCVLDLSVLFAR